MDSQYANHLSGTIVDICYEIHSTLGPGLLESVYEEILCYELDLRGIPYERQKGMTVVWKTVTIPRGYRCDVLVDKTVMVEIKSVESMSKVFSKTLLTYLKLSDTKLGLLINFNVPLIKDGITRIVNGL